ncbi:MAG: pyruvate dehydrogenase (acetyl-transferring), homodimeric type [Dehalococcoidia bacterium]|nr:pyruvate dehydrogenase (acetyl-transferring), homodimeric type [Dehalococcoidia bacterium]
MTSTDAPPQPSPADDLETHDWVDSLRDVQRRGGNARVSALLRALQIEAQRFGAGLPVTSTTPYVNTIAADRQPHYPGDRDLEHRLLNIIRWNAMAMVVEANQKEHGIGGHISTYASAAMLYEVAFNHFLRGPDHPNGADIVYFQGHASPGIYSRAYVEHRLTAAQLHDFRREFAATGGLSSYPHPWLMPEFWQYPTVSMGLSPILAIYQARFMRYLEDRGIIPRTDRKIWAFLGDGETDEPESLGAISLAARERLDNLVFVVNCNLQRLDGPVRGNGQIVQELEAVFRGVGWNVVKVLWGSEWDALLAQDHDGRLARRMNQIVDGEYQKYSVAGGAYIREHFWGVDPQLQRMVAHLSDEQLWRMRLGGHDPEKVYAAYHAATRSEGAPTVVLARTIKGYGLGEAGEGRNITHQQKALNESELLAFRDRLAIPLSDQEVVGAPLYRPAENSAEVTYLREHRRALGGPMPNRRARPSDLVAPPAELFDEFREGSNGREASSTMVFVRLLTKLMRDPQLGPRVVPIVPDEARTFGMDPMFREFGIYASTGQLYTPVDSANLLFYNEQKDGQILEEGITEAGAFSSFFAAGTSHVAYGPATLPFFIFYSMFGLQRIGDLAWAAADARCRGFLVGATSGRTSLPGEGLQHQDGHSHLLASAIPTLVAYDPAYAYEIAEIVRDGIDRMYVRNEDVYYYLTVGNEPYRHPPEPPGDDVRRGIVRGMYRLKEADGPVDRPRVQLLGSGAILNEALAAQELLADRFGVAADVWSVTSYTELRKDALSAERWNLLHPSEEPQLPFVVRCLGERPGVVVAATDYVKALPDGLAKWIPGPFLALGTDGFGRSGTRAELRNFFEVDARYIALAALRGLVQTGVLDHAEVQRAIATLGIDPAKPDPART